MSQRQSPAATARVDEALLREVAARILTVARPDRVILFGSAAIGEMTRESDIDLLILESDPGEPREAALRIRSTLGGLGVPFDVIVLSTERFEETKDVIGGIAYPAHKYGRIIYEVACTGQARVRKEAREGHSFNLTRSRSPASRPRPGQRRRTTAIRPSSSPAPVSRGPCATTPRWFDDVWRARQGSRKTTASTAGARPPRASPVGSRSYRRSTPAATPAGSSCTQPRSSSLRSRGHSSSRVLPSYRRPFFIT